MFPINVFSQLAVPFKVRYENTVKGDMAIISNNILNRINKKHTPNSPYNDQSYEAVANDDFDMEYIDVDQDKSTFSSSSAALFISNPKSKKVVYAGIYWSATYKYASGYKKGDDKFVPYDDERKPFEEIVIKFPGLENYSKIKGEIIFDGLKNKNFKEVAPYAAYADITDLVKTLDNPFDFYTVGNIRATEGTLLGGSSAGWTMVVVYEDNNLSEKKIVSQDGFFGVSNNSIDLTFNGLDTKIKGDVKARLATSALEGDFNVDGDLVYFSSSSNPTFYNLKANSRSTGNFFNSSITVNGENFKYRIPGSLNTLGYDSFYATIINPNNTYINDNVTSAKVRFKSSKDQFYIFFAALTIEVKKPNSLFDSETLTTEIVFEEETFKLKPKEENAKVINNYAKISDEIVALSDKTPIIENIETPIIEYKKPEKKVAEIVKNEKALIEENKVKADPISKMQNEKIEVEKQPQVTLDDINKREKKLDIPSVSKGYYIVANVFADKRNAATFMLTLRNNGLKPNYFINPKNNFLYVYLFQTEEREKAEVLYESNMNGLYESEIWILEVNLEKKI